MTALSIYMAMTWVSLLAWSALNVYCLPALARLIFGQARYYDPLKVIFIMLSMGQLGYGLRRVIKRSVIVSSPLELYFLIAFLGLATVGGVFAIFTLRAYAKSAREFVEERGYGGD